MVSIPAVALFVVIGAEAPSVRHFAEDDRRPQRPLALVAGRFDIAALEKTSSLPRRSRCMSLRSLRPSASVEHLLEAVQTGSIRVSAQPS
jgi:hypothetical protein